MDPSFASVSQAQAGLANCLYETLITRDSAGTLSFVPADYSGRALFSQSLIELNSHLHPEINLCYTGAEICSPEITTEDGKQFEEAAGRQPVIWDNDPVNDLEMQPELQLMMQSPRRRRKAGRSHSRSLLKIFPVKGINYPYLPIISAFPPLEE